MNTGQAFAVCAQHPGDAFHLCRDKRGWNQWSKYRRIHEGHRVHLLIRLARNWRLLIVQSTSRKLTNACARAYAGGEKQARKQELHSDRMGMPLHHQNRLQNPPHACHPTESGTNLIVNRNKDDLPSAMIHLYESLNQTRRTVFQRCHMSKLDSVNNCTTPPRRFRSR